VGLLDELEQRGMIDRRRDPADRRRHVVKLTAEGKKYLARLRALHESVDDEMLSPLTTEERAQLHSLLHRLVAHHDPRYGNGQD
jgi:MarR family transcriptional regulator, lower aerobic nicotinate degradation pathway regulator